MNASYEWLHAFVGGTESATELARLLTERCATVDEVVRLRGDLEPILVARVVEASRHPEADRLTLTKVDAGSGALLEVVCGAPNVKAGALYPFAPVGTTMPNGMKIEKRKIRGQVSEGMLCSAKELGLGEDHAGILALDVDVAPGTPFLNALPLGDARLVIDVAPNRPDLLSHLGIARELAAALGRKLALPRIPGGPKVPEPAQTRSKGKVGGIEVSIEDADATPRFTGAVIRGVTVGPGPAWLAERIAAVGGRPINNVVDATNYVLHELGQPVHAYDYAKVRGRKIAARKARAGETVVTLDGVTRKLAPHVTIIADADGPSGIAGIMGGRDSEVTESTTDLFVEVATFDPRHTRRGRRSLGLSTDASYRFERGVDPELAPKALQRVLSVILAVAGGTLDGAPVDLVARPAESRTLPLRPTRVAQIIGEPIPPELIAELLESIGFEVKRAKKSASMDVTVPSWRVDVLEEIDLIEEVARLHGYDRISDELRPFRPTTVPDAPIVAVSRRITERLVALGLLEVRPLPFVAGDDATHVRVRNPIAENEAHLRRAILETLSRRAEHNLAQMQRTVRLFEVGAVFAPAGGPMPAEEMHVAAVVLGERHPPHFTEPHPPAFDAWDIKFIAEEAARAAWPASPVEMAPASDDGDRLWTIRAGGREIGSVSRLPLDAPVWAAPAYGFEISLGAIESEAVAPPGKSAYVEAADRSAVHVMSYRPIPSMPAAEFDLALVVADSTPADEVERVLRQAAGELLERVALFDEFRGGDLPAGYRSLAWRLTFRHPERTLGAKELDGRRQKILKALESELGVQQRSS